MTAFQQALKHTLKWEGGDKFTDDPNDPGGSTKFGISQRAFPDLDIPNLTYPQAERIYLEHYWLPLNCEAVSLVDPVLAMKLFDMGVNLGVRRGAKIFQAAVQTLSPGIAVDGHIGPETLTALSYVDIPTVKELIGVRLENYYRSLDNPRFLKGWLNRAEDWPTL